MNRRSILPRIHPENHQKDQPVLDRLFVYGTLHPDRAPRELADLVARFQPLSPASVPGLLYDFGRYPALVLDPASPPVPGHLFRIPTDPETFARLDAYEGFHPSDPAASLFVRHETTVTLPDGSPETCWVYTYNQTLPPRGT